MAEILENGKVFRNLFVTDLKTIKIPKDFALSIIEYHPQLINKAVTGVTAGGFVIN